MKGVRVLFAAVLVVVQAWPFALLAQEKPGGVVTTVEVDILSLDVLVVDRKDRPVFGLEGKDFEVKIAGKVQPFEFFEAPAATLRPGGGDGPELIAGTSQPLKAGGRPDRHVLFFVDLEQLPRPVIGAAAEAIRLALQPSASSRRVGLVANFGGIGTLAWETTGLENILPELETLATPPDEERGRAWSSAGSRVPDVVPPSYEARLFLENSLIDAIVQEEQTGAARRETYRDLSEYLVLERRRVQRVTEDLKSIATRFVNLEGTRHLVYVSSGIERIPGLNVVNRLHSALATRVKGAASRSSESALPDRAPKREADLLAFNPSPLFDLDQLRTWLGASGITLHFLDPTPLGADLGTAEDRFASTAGQRTGERDALQAAPRQWVDVTGGIARQQSGGLEKALTTFLDAAAATYRIGVRLTDVDTRKTYRVSVSVKKPGVTALARSAYQPRGKAAAVAAAAALLSEAASARLKAAVDEKREGVARLAKTPLPVTILWKGKSPLASNEPGKTYYRLEVAIPHDDLHFSPESDSMVASVRIVVVAKATGSAFTDTFTEDLFLSFNGAEYKDALGSSAKKLVTLALPPGAYELNVTVQDALEDRFGSAALRVDAPP